MPSTTYTNPNEYTELFTKIRAAHPDSIIVRIGYTSKASSSFQNANIAAADFEDIRLIDALNVSGGLTAIVMYAAFLLKKSRISSWNVSLVSCKAVYPRAVCVHPRKSRLSAG